MNIKTVWKKKENAIIAILYTIVICGILAWFFDYYYELNDDYFIKNILSGVYSGTPSAHSIQMLYPLSLLLSGLYRINRNISWFGLFMNLCQFGCIALITERMLSLFPARWKKIAVLVGETIFLAGFMIKEMVFVQYTFTTAFLAATAAFLFYTSEPAYDVKSILKKNLISIILVVVAFNVRSEMLLLMLPFICVTGVCKWAMEKPAFTSENVKKYFSVFGCIIAGLLLSYVIDVMAYSGSEWKEFRTFFNNRTELYDFQSIPSYDENEEFYQSINMSREEQILLVNYNFGMDDNIDAEKMGQIAQYAKKLREQRENNKKEIIKDVIKDYVYRTFRGIDTPWNLIAVIMYVMVFLIALCNSHFRFIWELGFMGIVRTGLWFFLLYRGRLPERITHSMYFMEFLILLAMLLKEYQKNRISKIIFGTECFVLMAFCSMYIPQNITKQYENFEKNERLYKRYQDLKDYTKQHADNFYFWDVATFSQYTEKMFVDVDNTLSNIDIMGGWLNKSPLTEEKLSLFEIDSMEDAILNKDNVYVIVTAGESKDYPALTEWIKAYYDFRGKNVTVNQVDNIYTDGKEIFRIYQVNPEK